jgi:hypothetical protein
VLRRALIATAGVHLVYPLGVAIAWSYWPGDAGGYGPILMLPVIFLVMVIVVGPLVWIGWRGGRVAPWLLFAFVVLETRLYWNGSRTPSWSRRDASDRFALTMFFGHALTAAVLAAATLVARRPTRTYD